MGGLLSKIGCCLLNGGRDLGKKKRLGEKSFHVNKVKTSEGGFLKQLLGIRSLIYAVSFQVLSRVK